MAISTIIIIMKNINRSKKMLIFVCVKLQNLTKILKALYRVLQKEEGKTSNYGDPITCFAVHLVTAFLTIT